MNPPESEPSSTLPTLTWEPIVDRGRRSGDGAGSAAASDPRRAATTQAGGGSSAPAMPTMPTMPPLSLGDPATPVAPVVGSLSLHLGDVTPVPPAPPLPPVQLRATAQPVEILHATFGDGETDVEMSLPTIREATPVTPYVADGPALAEAPSVVATTTVPLTGSTPMLPGSQPAAIVLPMPTQPDQSARAVAAMSPLAVEIPQRRPAAKRTGRTGLKLVLALVVLGSLVAGAIVFGRPYLFPDEWTATAEPYATAVMDSTDTEFDEPLTVIAEPTDDYSVMSTAQLAGDFAGQVPAWRALGLATGDVTDASLAELLAGWQPAMYSVSDGQIHHDAALEGDTAQAPELDARLTVAMATALLDQEFGWAAGQAGRTLDGAALIEAEVLAQATAIQRDTEFATEVAPSWAGPLAYLPSVLSYQTLAPAMYAPLLPPASADADNRLGSLEPPAFAAGFGAEALELASPATLTAGDVAVGSPAAMDRSFWYLVFAGFLDASSAYGASESIVESALTITEQAGTTCAYATFSGGDLIQTDTLRSAMESWVGRTPVEMGAEFSVGADGNLQIRSCDPGAQSPASTRLGVARELVGWRSAELATISGVLASGGGDTEITAARERLAASRIGAELAGGPVDQSPTDAAAAAKAAVETIVTPPPPEPEAAD